MEGDGHTCGQSSSFRFGSELEGVTGLANFLLIEQVFDHISIIYLRLLSTVYIEDRAKTEGGHHDPSFYVLFLFFGDP